MARRHLKVLLIEDNPGDIRLIREMLTEAKDTDFHLTSASGLAEGLMRLRQAKFDIILLDLLLPDSQGLETFHAMRQKAPEVPIVVLSGFDDEALAMGAVQGGGARLLGQRAGG